MPVAILEDRSLAKSLYLEGLTLKEVAQQLNVKLQTLCSWKCREKWDELPRKSMDSKDSAIQSVAKDFSERTLRNCEKVLCKVESLGLRDLRDCKDAATSVAAAYATARKALGLDDQQAQVHLHLHASRSRPTKADDSAATQAPILDVTPTPGLPDASKP